MKHKDQTFGCIITTNRFMIKFLWFSYWFIKYIIISAHKLWTIMMIIYDQAHWRNLNALSKALFWAKFNIFYPVMSKL